MEANKTILQMKYARIVPIFAEQTGITLEDALDFFYTSSIYQMITLQLILPDDMREISARIKCSN